MIQEDFGFTSDGTFAYYANCGKENYLAVFKNYINSQGDKIATAYNELCGSLKSDSSFCGKAVNRDAIAERAAIIKLTSDLVCECFDLHLDKKAIYDLFLELSMRDSVGDVLEPSSIMAYIIACIDFSDIKAIITTADNGRESEEIVIRYDAVKNAILKKYNGISYIKILDILNNDNYIHHGERRRTSDGVFRFESKYNNEKVIKIWRNKVEEFIPAAWNNVLPGGETETA